MTIDDRPDSVLEETTRHLGYNCVACVTAVLFNELGPSGIATANMVAARFNIAPRYNLDVSRALWIIHDFAKLTPRPGKRNPWDPDAPDGYYAVFCLGRPHVIFGFRAAPRYYLYDPQVERDRDLATLIQEGFGPFECFHFGE